MPRLSLTGKSVKTANEVLRGFTMLAGIVLCVGSSAAQTPSSGDKKAADLAAAAQQEQSAAGLPQSASAITVLLEKAEFWSQRGNQDVALGVYRRILSLQPDNLEALAGAVKAATDSNHPEEAQSYLEKLRKFDPDAPQIADADADRRRSSEDAALLYNARILVANGKIPQALEAYKKLFRGGPVSDEYAAEYYPTYISSLPTDSADAYDALTEFSKIASKYPKNYLLQLNYAQVQASIEAQRSDGIDKLRELSKIPAISAAARRIWRQALLWQGADFRPQEQLEQYLKENPSDPEIEAKRREYIESLPSEAKRASLRAMARLGENNLAQAEKEFRAAVSGDPTDALSTILLAGVLRRQGSPEWEKFHKAAIALAPDRKKEFDLIVGADAETNARAAAAASKVVQARFSEVSRLAQQGEFGRAEELMKELIRENRNAGSIHNLGLIQLRAGKLTEAIATLKEASQLAPNDAEIETTTCTALYKANRNAEADRSCDRATQLATAANDQVRLRTIAAVRADYIRAQAAQIKNPVEKEAKLNQALALDDTNPWVRLTLANLQLSRGNQGEANKLMAPVVALALGQSSVAGANLDESRTAGFLWAQSRKDYATAGDIALRVPEASRSDGMRTVLALQGLRQQVAASAANSNPEQRAATLLKIAAAPDPTGERGLLIGGLFIQAHDTAGLRRALALGLQNTPNPTPQQRIAYTGMLLQTRQLSAAQDQLNAIDLSRIAADQRAVVLDMYDNIAAAQADNLIQREIPAQADGVIDQALRRHPDSIILKVAKARVDTALGRPAAALPVLLTILQKDPSNLAARMGAIDAAMSLKQLERADDLLTSGMQLYPNDPILVMQAANVARLRGMNGRALDYLERAKQLRAQQMTPTSSDTNGG